LIYTGSPSPNNQTMNELSALRGFAVNDSPQRYDLREVITFCWRQWKFIASVVCLALIIAVVTVAKMTPYYTATTVILLEPDRTKITSGDASEINQLDDAMVENQLSIIGSTVFLKRVAEKEHLDSDPEFGSQSPQGPSIFAQVLSILHLSAAENRPTTATAPAVSTDPDLLHSIGALRGATSAKRNGEGYTLSISVTSKDPTRAAHLSNAVADAYVVDKLDARFEAAKRASGWLSDRLVELRQQLHDSEEAVAQFRADHGFVQSGSNITLNEQQLSELNAKLLAARSEVAEKKARAELFESILSKGGDIQSMPGLPPSTTLVALQQQENTISQQVAELSRHYNSSFPLLINTQGKLNDIHRAILAEIQQINANVQNDYELAKKRAESMELTFQKATGQTGIDDKTAITLRELERTAAVNKSLFEDFLQRAKITEQQSTFEARDARVITPAVRPGAASFPRTSQILTIALVLGMFLGVGGAAAKEHLSPGFTTPKQIEDLLEVPVLSSVSRMSSKDLTIDGKELAIPHYVAAKPLSRLGEAIRTLRVGIQMSDVDNIPKVVQLTSTVPNEGKTTIALALAMSAAVSGSKVLFIDADLRHPSASRFFGIQKESGLVDVLLGHVEAQDVIKFRKHEKLWALSAGSSTRNPSDLLESDRMKSFIALCRQSFDFVVVDTPPIGPVIDAFIVAKIVDKVVYVVHWASTPRELVQQTSVRLPGKKKLAGVLFNLVNEKLALKYGKYSYQYYYRDKLYGKYYNT
jgi:succinoglycan biosynthesis transport protein ExoP